MTAKETLAILTIGQAPRDDVVPSMRRFFPPVDIVQAGALDGLSKCEIKEMFDPSADFFVTRLTDGSEVKVNREVAHHLVKKRGEAVVAVHNPRAVLLLCTGSFPPLSLDTLVIEPDKILLSTVKAVLNEGRRKVGVLFPASEQREFMKDKWGDVAADVYLQAMSPYDERDREAAFDRIVQQGCDLIVMDCMGYRQTLRQRLRGAAEAPVVLANEMVARVVGGFL